MSLEAYAHFIKTIHTRWKPHAGQVAVGRPLFGDERTQIGVECGRNFGKTDLCNYALYRTAILRPKTTNYYIGPYQNQAREIIWASQRLQTFAPEFIKDVSGINNTEMRITLFNDSFIKVDGSDNVDRYRGVKLINGSLMVLDEYKDIRPEFYQATDPNLIDANLLVLGTPPENDTHFQQLMDEFAKNPAKHYFNFPSEINPHIKRAWLESKRAELYEKGEGDVWEREYMARRVKGGKNAVFPMAANIRMRQHADILAELRRDMRKLQWFVIADPGTVTCFAVLFVALNPYTKTIYFMDSIYEKDQNETSSQKIGKRIVDIKASYNGVTWDEVVDEAAAWFRNEAHERFDSLNFRPTSKASADKESGIGLIKDVLLANKAVFSERVGPLVWELQNLIKDANGKVPKMNDHLIDCFRYFLAAAGYQLESEQEPRDREKSEDFRGARMEDDFPQLRSFSGGEFDE